MKLKNKIVRGIFIFIAVVTILGMVMPMGMMTLGI
jgi:hypothetical protein